MSNFEWLPVWVIVTAMTSAPLVLGWIVFQYGQRFADLCTRNVARIKVGAVVVASLAAFPFVVKALTQSLILLGHYVLMDSRIELGSVETFVYGMLTAVVGCVALVLLSCLCWTIRELGFTPVAWLRSKAEAEERERLRAAQERVNARAAEIREQRAIAEERERLERLERLDRERMEAIETHARDRERMEQELRASRMSMLVGLDPAANVARPVQVDSGGAIVVSGARISATHDPVDRFTSSPITVPATALCPVCKAQVLDGCAIVFCGACRLVHHEECASGHKCAAYGCGAELKSGDVAFCDAPAFLCTCVCGCKAPVHVIGRCLECVRGEKCP